MSETHAAYLAHGTPEKLRQQRKEIDALHTRSDDAVSVKEST